MAARATMSWARLDQLRAAIRARGLRATPTRISVLDVIRASEGPLSHAELVRRLARLERDPATIHRNLAVLTSARLVRRVDLGDHVGRFVAEDGAPPSCRAHFVCTACRSVLALPRVEISAPAAPRAIARGEIEIRIHGRCNECA